MSKPTCTRKACDTELGDKYLNIFNGINGAAPASYCLKCGMSILKHSPTLPSKLVTTRTMAVSAKPMLENISLMLLNDSAIITSSRSILNTINNIVQRMEPPEELLDMITNLQECLKGVEENIDFTYTHLKEDLINKITESANE